jgi:hypothetical protein
MREFHQQNKEDWGFKYFGQGFSGNLVRNHFFIVDNTWAFGVFPDHFEASHFT